MKKILIALIALSCAVAYAADYTPVIEEKAPSFDEVSVDSKYVVVGGDATTGLMVQAANITSTGTTETNTFAVAYGAAPVVTISYTEDCGDVQPCYVSAVTTTNFICTVTSSKNYAYVAVGARP